MSFHCVSRSDTFQVACGRSVTPPATEKYQNCVGTTLCRLRSLAIHCTRNRAEKRLWPTRPIPSPHAPSRAPPRITNRSKKITLVLFPKLFAGNGKWRAGKTTGQ